MSWLDKNQNKILIAIWSAIFLTCLLVILSDPVKAASQDSTDLPYVVENGLPEDLSFFQDLYITNATNYGYPTDMIYRGNWDSDNIIAYYYLNDGRFAYVHIYVPYNNNPSYSVSLSKQYGIFDIDTDYSDLYLANYQHIQYRSNDGSPWYYDNIWEGNFTLRLFGGNIIPDFVSGDFYDSTDNLILTTESVDPVIDSGHASEPVDNHGHYIEDGNGNRIPKPNKPTPTVFTPPSIQFPTVDTSSLEKLLESLIDLVQYFISYIGGVISGWFSNLLSNLDNWFDYVVQSFNYAVNNIVGAIKDLAQTFYNNMVSLFEPLYEFFNGVATFFNNLVQLGMDGDSFSLSTFFYNLLVPDPEDFAESLLDLDIHHIVPLARIVKTKFVSIFDSFYNLTPTKVFLLPSFTWHGHTYNLTMDFSWYDDYKVYGDTIITGFLVIGYIYWFVLQLNTMFRGGSSIGHDVSKVGGKE